MIHRLYIALASLLLVGCSMNIDKNNASDQVKKPESSTEKTNVAADSKTQELPASGSSNAQKTNPSQRRSAAHLVPTALAPRMTPSGRKHQLLPFPNTLRRSQAGSSHAEAQTESTYAVVPPGSARLPKIWNSPDQPEDGRDKIEVWRGTERTVRDRVTGQ